MLHKDKGEYIMFSLGDQPRLISDAQRRLATKAVITLGQVLNEIIAAGDGTGIMDAVRAVNWVRWRRECRAKSPAAGKGAKYDA